MAFVLATKAAVPAKTEPLHGVEDGIDVFLFLFFWVGVVKAHVAHTIVVACQAKVQADAFGMTHVQVAIGLGRETGTDFGWVGRASTVVCPIAGAAAPATLGMGALCKV